MFGESAHRSRGTGPSSPVPTYVPIPGRRLTLDAHPTPSPLVTPAPRSGPQAARRALLLLTGTPREILARLVQGDPLGLRAVVEAALRERALLFDAPTVLRRTLALVAHRANAWRGRPSLVRWLKARVDEALDQLLEEDLGLAPFGPHDPLEDLGPPLGLAPAALRGARARFHRLDTGTRDSFVALVVEGQDLDGLARLSGRTVHELARGARRGLEAWSVALPSDARREGRAG